MRVFFEVFRFYFLVWLRGDPVEPKPKATTAPRTKPASVVQLRPLEDVD